MNAHLIKRPHITEKTLLLANQDNMYTFEVDKKATRNQIKELVEKLFGVEVLAVRTSTKYRVLKTTGRKRMKSLQGLTKKAMVTVKKGQKINLFDLGGNE